MSALAQTGAAPVTTTPAAAPAASDAPADPMICKQMGAAIGSRLGGRMLCLKQSEWKANRHQAQQSVDYAQRIGAQVNANPGQ